MCTLLKSQMSILTQQSSLQFRSSIPHHTYKKKATCSEWWKKSTPLLNQEEAESAESTQV